MTMTVEQTRAHERYEEAPKIFRQAVDDAYRAARSVLTERGFDVANDDRAEALIAAISVYLEESAAI